MIAEEEFDLILTGLTKAQLTPLTMGMRYHVHTPTPSLHTEGIQPGPRVTRPTWSCFKDLTASTSEGQRVTRGACGGTDH